MGSEHTRAKIKATLKHQASAQPPAFWPAVLLRPRPAALSIRAAFVRLGGCHGSLQRLGECINGHLDAEH
eukprot:2167169-Alexandrium_andersonii.AAC.1